MGKINYVLLISFLLLIGFSRPLTAQNLEGLEKFLPKDGEDTTYVVQNRLKWSVRQYTIVKTQIQSLRNTDSKATISFAPNNRLSVGAGLSYKSLFLDIAVNLKLDQDNPTKRFDFQSALLVKSSLIGVHVQDYRGFGVVEEGLLPAYFRPDIRSRSVGLSYTYLANGKNMSLGTIFAGTQRQKKSSGAFGIGLFSLYNDLRADSSIVPLSRIDDFNSKAMIRESKSFTVGVFGNYSYFAVLPKHLFLFGSVAPGIGYNRQKIVAIEEYIAPKHYSLRLSTWISGGYSGRRFYAVLGFLNEFHHMPLGFDNRQVMDIGKVKLVLGWKFGRKDLFGKV